MPLFKSNQTTLGGSLGPDSRSAAGITSPSKKLLRKRPPSQVQGDQRPPPPPLFSRIQLAAALIEYEDDHGGHSSEERKRAIDSAILSPFLKKKEVTEAELESEVEDHDYFGDNVADNRQSTFRPNSMISNFRFGAGGSTPGSRTLDLPPIDGPGTPGSRTLDLPFIDTPDNTAFDAEQEEEEEEETLAKDWGLDRFIKPTSSKDTKRPRGRAKSDFDFQNFLKTGKAATGGDGNPETRSLPDMLTLLHSNQPSQISLDKLLKTSQDGDGDLKAPPRIGRRFESFDFPRKVLSPIGQAAEPGELSPRERSQSVSRKFLDSINHRPRAIHHMSNLDFSDAEAEELVSGSKKEYSVLDFERYRRGGKPETTPTVTNSGDDEHQRAMSLDTGRMHVLKDLCEFRRQERQEGAEVKVGSGSVLNRGRPRSTYIYSSSMKQTEEDILGSIEEIKARIAELRWEVSPGKPDQVAFARSRSHSLQDHDVLNRPRLPSTFEKSSPYLPRISPTVEPKNERLASVLERGRPKSLTFDPSPVIGHSQSTSILNTPEMTLRKSLRTTSIGLEGLSSYHSTPQSSGRPKSLALDSFRVFTTAPTTPNTFPSEVAENSEDWFADLKKERFDHDRTRAVSLSAMSMLNKPSAMIGLGLRRKEANSTSSTSLLSRQTHLFNPSKSSIEPMTAEEAALPPSMAPRPASRASLRANLEDDPEETNSLKSKRLSYSSRLDPKHLEELQKEIEDRPRFIESRRPKAIILPEPLDPRYRLRKKIENGDDLDDEDWILIQEEMRLEEGEEAPTLMVERRPVGKLFGRSLMDDMEMYKLRRKQQNRLLQTPSRLYGGTSTTANDAWQQSDIAAEGDASKRQRMTKTQSFFGPDMFLQKELDKLKKIEAQEEQLREEEKRKHVEKDAKKKKRNSATLEMELTDTVRQADVKRTEFQDDSDDDVPLGHLAAPTLSLPRVGLLPHNMEHWFEKQPDEQSALSHGPDLPLVRHPSPPIITHPSHLTHVTANSRAISVTSMQGLLSSSEHPVPAPVGKQESDSDFDDIPLARVVDTKRKPEVFDVPPVLSTPGLDHLRKDDDSLDDEIPLSMLPKKSLPPRSRSTHQDNLSDDDQPLAYRVTHLALEGQRATRNGDDDDDVPLALKLVAHRQETEDDVPLALRKTHLNTMSNQAVMMAQMQQTQHMTMMMGMGGMGMGMGMGMGGPMLMNYPSMGSMHMAPNMGMGYGLHMPQPMPMGSFMGGSEDGGNSLMIINPNLNDSVNRWRKEVSTEEG